VDKLLTHIKSSCSSSNVSIVSYGWTDIARYLFINFKVSSKNGPMFLRAVDALGKQKDANYMAGLFIKFLGEVGVDSCMQTIIDNASMCKVVGMIV